MVEVSVGKFPVFASGFQLVCWVVGFLSWLFSSVSCLSSWFVVSDWLVGWVGWG